MRAGSPPTEKASWRERTGLGRHHAVGSPSCLQSSPDKREVIPQASLPFSNMEAAEGLKEGGEIWCQETQVHTAPTPHPPGSEQEALSAGSWQPCRRTNADPHHRVSHRDYGVNGAAFLQLPSCSWCPKS